MARIYLQRISYEWNYTRPLLDLGFVMVGWAGYAEKYDLPDIVRKEGREGFDRFMTEQHDTTRSRLSLYRFLIAEPGDMMLIPLPNGEFALAEVEQRAEKIAKLPYYTITGLDGKEENRKFSYELLYGHPGKDEWVIYDRFVPDLGFFMKVKDVKIFKRANASPALQSRMKMYQANGDITDLADDIEAVRTAKAPVDAHNLLSGKLSEEILAFLHKYITSDGLEKLVCKYMKAVGASKAYIPAKNETGKTEGADADVVAEFDRLGTVILIQVKMHEGETDEWALEQIHLYAEWKASASAETVFIPWVISTGEFSDRTRNKAIEMNIRLLDGKAFAGMIAEMGIEFLTNEL